MFVSLVILFVIAPASCQGRHGHSRLRGVSGGAGDAGYVRWDEAGGCRHRAVRHRPVPESEKPDCGPGPHVPGHSAQPLPA